MRPDIRLLQSASFAEVCRDTAKESPLSGLENTRRQIEPAASLSCLLPEVLIPEFQDPGFFFPAGQQHSGTKNYNFKPAYFHTMPYAELVSSVYAVISFDQYLIQDSYFNPQKLAETGQFMQQNLKVNMGQGMVEIPFALYRPTQPTKPMPPSYLPVYYWHFNYHHWLIECLPRIIDYLQQPELKDQYKLILPQGLNRFQQDTLELLEIDPKNILWYDQQPARFETLCIPSLGNFSPQQLQKLRDCVFSKLADLSSGPRKRLYISRRDATERQITNEMQLKPLLEAAGFEWVLLQGMPLQQQIRLFQQAEVIMGPHGAGLSNCIFAPEDALLIELMPNDAINHCFWLLASSLGLRYSYMMGQIQGPNRHFEISESGLKKLLKAL